MREWPLQNDRIRIGRNQQSCQIFINNPQVSWEHCDILYDRSRKQFQIVNHSGNRTYTQRGTLEREQSVCLQPGEWFYLQTNEQQFVFYVEVKS